MSSRLIPAQYRVARLRFWPGRSPVWFQSAMFGLSSLQANRLLVRMAGIPALTARPAIVFTLLGIVSIWLPQLLGNGKDISQLAFTNQVALPLLLILLVLRPAATVLSVRSGAPGGLFTPSLTVGALLGAVLGHAWSWVWPGVPPGLFAVLGAAAVLAATTQGPISTVVLMMELTGRDRSFIVPLLLAVTAATLVARTIELRSIYDARLTDEEVEERRKARELPATGSAESQPSN